MSARSYALHSVCSQLPFLFLSFYKHTAVSVFTVSFLHFSWQIGQVFLSSFVGNTTEFRRSPGKLLKATKTTNMTLCIFQHRRSAFTWNQRVWSSAAHTATTVIPSMAYTNTSILTISVRQSLTWYLAAITYQWHWKRDGQRGETSH